MQSVSQHLEKFLVGSIVAAVLACAVAVCIAPAKAFAAGGWTVTAGCRQTAAISPDGSLYTWGNNEWCQLGVGSSTNDQLAPVRVLGNVSQVSLGGELSAAVTKDGFLYTWGRNISGGLGDGTVDIRVRPAKISGLSGVSQVSVGYAYSAAVTKDGSLYTWGDNRYGQLGHGLASENDVLVPKKVESLQNVIQVSVGKFHSIALTSDGSLYTWGSNACGELGDGTFTDRANPLKILDNVVQVFAGCTHSAAITKDGSLYMWGENCFGQLGDGTSTNRANPVKVMGDVIQASLGDGYSAAITKDGSLYTWGWNYNGQLGDGTDDGRSKPGRVMGDIAQVSLGGDHSAAIAKDGSLYMWGGNDNGQLGDGTYKGRTLPVKVVGLGASAAPVFKVANVKQIRPTKTLYFNLAVSSDTPAPRSFSSNSMKVTVNQNGRVKVAKGFVGQAKITITTPAVIGFARGSKTITVTVNPRKVTSKKSSSPSSGILKLAWAKESKAAAYQVEVSKSKNFSKAKPYKVKKAKSSLTVGGLKSGKTYYARIRALQKVSGKMYYGAWSKIRKAKVK